MVTKIQKTRFNLKPVTNCYNLIHKKACIIPEIFVYYSMIKGEKNMNNLVLKSVGCVVDDEGWTHPIEFDNNVNMTPDVAVHLSDVVDEWWENLDFATCWELFHYIEDNVDSENNSELFNSSWKDEKLKLSGKEQILTFVEGV